MRVPVNYSEWCVLFDEMAKGPRNEDYLDVVGKGQISWTSGYYI